MPILGSAQTFGYDDDGGKNVYSYFKNTNFHNFHYLSYLTYFEIRFVVMDSLIVLSVYLMRMGRPKWDLPILQPPARFNQF